MAELPIRHVYSAFSAASVAYIRQSGARPIVAKTNQRFTLLLRDIYCIVTSASIHLYHVRLSCVIKRFTYLLTYLLHNPINSYHAAPPSYQGYYQYQGRGG